MKRIFCHFNILNLILLCLCGITLYYVYFDLYQAGELTEDQIEELVAVQEEEVEEDEATDEDNTANKQTTSLDYGIIAEKNLFHPERKIPPEKKQQVELPKPEFVLYGTVITDELKIAYVEDVKAVKTTQGRGKRQIPLKVGQSLSGFVLKEVTQNSAVFIRGDERIEVKVATQKGKRTDVGQIKGVPSPQVQPKQGQPNIQPKR